MDFRCACLLPFVVWAASAAAQPQTHEKVEEIPTMLVGRTPAQIGIPSDLARHTAGRDRRVDRSTAEAAIRQMWLAVNGRVQHPSLAVQGEINRITKQYGRDQQGVSLLEEARRDIDNTEGHTIPAQESHAVNTDEVGHSIIRDQRSSFASTQDVGDVLKTVQENVKGSADFTGKQAEEYMGWAYGNFKRLDALTGEPILALGDSVAEFAKRATSVAENGRRVGLDNSIMSLKAVWDELGKAER